MAHRPATPASRLVKLILPLLLASCAIAAPVRADDWLAALPECAAPSGASAARASGPAIEYPRPGLPAVVAAGQRLVSRVRLPLPLTPPPGIQQARALREYSAELRALTPELSPSASVTAIAPTTTVNATARKAADVPPAHRYRMEVIGVRPEGASSLRYRVTIPVPAWAAPGAYMLRLVAAGVVLPGEAPVVVLAQEALPRLRALAAEDLAHGEAAQLPEGARTAVDIWVRDESASVERSDMHTHLGAPVLEPKGLVAALRVGNGLWVLGDCPGPHLPFADEVRSLLRVERRARLAAAPVEAASPMQAQPPVDAVAVDTPAEPQHQLQAGHTADGSSSVRARAAQAFELSFLVRADGRPLSASAGTLELYPATELPAPGSATASKPPLLVARWLLPVATEGALVQAARKVAVRALPIELQPSPVPSGHLLRVSAPAPGGNATPPLLALRFDERSSAFGSGEASHRFTALGTARMRALAILPDGTAVSSSPTVEIVTEAAVGCRAGAAQEPDATLGAALALWAAPWLLKRRPRRGAGNRLGARSRSRDQPRPRRAVPVMESP
jgi:hypothetical protein